MYACKQVEFWFRSISVAFGEQICIMLLHPYRLRMVKVVLGIDIENTANIYKFIM